MIAALRTGLSNDHEAAFRFYHRFVAPNASLLARYPALRVWTECEWRVMPGSPHRD